MIKVEDIEVYGWEAAIRGMRNPKNSWEKSDSHQCHEGCPMVECEDEPAIGCNDGKYGYCIGVNDLDLMKRLYKGGTEHRKYLRMITVTMDITAPLYWWKEFDTYKIGTVANSCSTMHTIHKNEFTLEDFSHEHLGSEVIINGEQYNIALETLQHTITVLNTFRQWFIETRGKQYWYQMIQLLPTSYNQKRTVTMNYENAANMIHQRTGHKLDEWREFVKVLEKLPYLSEIMCRNEGENA